MRYEQPVLLQTAQFDVNTAADKATLYAPMFKSRVHLAAVSIAGTDAGGATIKFDRRITAGSDTGRGDGDAGVVIIPASNCAGLVKQDNSARGLIINPGDQIVVEVTAEGVAALNVCAQLWLVYEPEEVGNLTDVAEV